ncbi:hypothetical protein [Kordiimonas laminariae]|uniref:hypothetical protein n=1 Tax=Kordiimonas laminariae TaxID=2917717 RepID=UPI001FF55974|nr:hypothetical protein [Kordiimonas laminariae]MCK0070729.1 hypothetical protein [Kordiimonas laminariae]
MHKILKKKKNGLFAGGGILGAISAFIGASCCVLPLLLFQAGVSSAAIAQLGFFARYREEFLFGSLALVIAGIVASFWGGRRPSVRTLVIFAIALIFIGLAYIIPYHERELLIFFGFRQG